MKLTYKVASLLLALLASCKIATTEVENPFTVANAYCHCLEEQFINAKDSSVNLKDCEDKIISGSRFLKIYVDYDNKDNYAKATLDSADNFAIKVRNIEDTLCYSKIDFKKVKKIPHIKM